MCENIVENQLLDLKVNHHISVKLALQQPPQRLQVWDVVADLCLTARGSSVPRGHGPEEQLWGVLPPRWSRPPGPGLEGTVIDHYGGRCGMETPGWELEYRVRDSFTVLEGENLKARLFG